MTIYPSPSLKLAGTVGLWLVFGVCLIRFIPFLQAEATRPSHGFVVFYTAAHLVAEGQDSALFYEYDWFNTQIARFIPPHIKDINVNPPLLNMLLLPLVGLDYAQARAVWTAVSLACLGGSIWLWVRELKLTAVWLPAIGIGVLLFQPVYANLRFGQIYLFLLLLVSVVWWGQRHGREGVAGVALAGLLMLKVAVVFGWPLWVVWRRWKALGWGTAVSLGLFLFSLPWLGWQAWLVWLQQLLAPDARLGPSVTAYQTTFSFFRHLFSYDAQWNPAPLVNAPLLGAGLAWGTFFVLLAFTLKLAANLPPTPTTLSVGPADLLITAVIILSVVLNPLALDYHYPLLLLPGIILCVWAWSLPAHRAVLWLVLVGIVLIAADLPYSSPQLAAGWLALLAYPKLYGGLLLWAVACWGARGRWASKW